MPAPASNPDCASASCCEHQRREPRLEALGQRGFEPQRSGARVKGAVQLRAERAAQRLIFGQQRRLHVPAEQCVGTRRIEVEFHHQTARSGIGGEHRRGQGAVGYLEHVHGTEQVDRVVLPPDLPQAMTFGRQANGLRQPAQQQGGHRAADAHITPMAGSHHPAPRFLSRPPRRVIASRNSRPAGLSAW